MINHHTITSSRESSVELPYIKNCNVFVDQNRCWHPHIRHPPRDPLVKVIARVCVILTRGDRFNWQAAKSNASVRHSAITDHLISQESWRSPALLSMPSVTRISIEMHVLPPRKNRLDIGSMGSLAHDLLESGSPYRREGLSSLHLYPSTLARQESIRLSILLPHTTTTT